MKYSILFFAIFIFLCTHSLAAETPFTIEKGYLIIPVKIKKDIHVEMLVATGSDVSLIDFGATEKYKLRVSYTGVGIITGNNDRTVTFSEVGDVTVGDEKPKSLFMKLGELNSIKKRLGRDIFGVLGADFFKGKTVKFDFKNKVFSFVEQLNEKDQEVSKDTANRFLYKMTYLKPNIFGSEISLPVSNEVIINGKKIKTLFDTGVVFAISILPSVVKELGLETPEKETVKVLQINSLKFFDYEIKDIPSILIGKNSSLDQDTKDYGSIIGMAVLQNFSVTFDYKKKLILLER